MKVERRVVILSEYDSEITDPKKGFIVVGNVCAAMVDEENRPGPGFIGHNFDTDGKVNRWMAFTKEEMVKVLGYTVEELEEIVAKWKGEKSRKDIF
jgi:hypothetical protein